MAKILIVEDDVALCDSVRLGLESLHHIVESCHTGVDALERIRACQYDAIILDWDLPQTSGVEVCSAIRSARLHTKVLMLTGRVSIADKEVGFNAGADDYLTKPFNMKELELRIRALLQRPTAIVDTILTARNISLDTGRHLATLNGEPIKLLPREFALLQFLMSHPNQAVSAEALLERLWSTDAEVTLDAVATCVRRLRKKVDLDPDSPLIMTDFKIGYRLVP